MDKFSATISQKRISGNQQIKRTHQGDTNKIYAYAQQKTHTREFIKTPLLIGHMKLFTYPTVQIDSTAVA